MKFSYAIFALSALFITAAVPNSLAAQHEQWESFQNNETCWALTKPTDSAGDRDAKDNPYLSIQNKPNESIKGSIAIISGYKTPRNDKVTLNVDGKEFETLTYNNTVFVGTGSPETELTQAMLRGNELLITWTDDDGNFSTDTYSLAGFTSAKAKIDADCK